MSQSLSATERVALLTTFREGAGVLEFAYRTAPVDAQRFRLSPGEWTILQIVCHCADSEILMATQARMIIADPGVSIVTIDQDRWANVLNYDRLDADAALAMVRANREVTASMLSALSVDVGPHEGVHTETGSYPLAEWLRYNSRHMHVHAEQIHQNVRAFEPKNRDNLPFAIGR